MRRQAKSPGKVETRGSEPLHLDQVASRIIEIRNRHGWGQRELARRAGLFPARLSKLERGLSEPRLSELVRLARELGVGLDELVFGEAPANPTLQVVRELGALGTPEETAVLGRLLRLLLLGYRAAGSGKEAP